MVAVILGQTLFFKFSGAAESVFIFRSLGIEPWGRILTGALELVAVVLILVPRTAAFGALLAVGLMAGAVLSHLARLGIAVQGDHGLLFGLALTVLLCSSIVALVRRREFSIAGGAFSRTANLQRGIR